MSTSKVTVVCVIDGGPFQHTGSGVSDRYVLGRGIGLAVLGFKEDKRWNRGDGRIIIGDDPSVNIKKSVVAVVGPGEIHLGIRDGDGR